MYSTADADADRVSKYAFLCVFENKDKQMTVVAVNTIPKHSDRQHAQRYRFQLMI